MPKIRVELEVPNVKYCKTCEYREYCKACEYSRYDTGDFACCTLFSGAITLREQDGLPERCIECEQAEVKNDS